MRARLELDSEEIRLAVMAHVERKGYVVKSAAVEVVRGQEPMRGEFGAGTPDTVRAVVNVEEKGAGGQ